MEKLQPFTIFFTPAPGMSQSEIADYINRLYLQQKAIDGLLHGEVDPDYCLDMLAQNGIDPNDWANNAADQIEFVLNGEVWRG